MGPTFLKVGDVWTSDSELLLNWVINVYLSQDLYQFVFTSFDWSCAPFKIFNTVPRREVPCSSQLKVDGAGVHNSLLVAESDESGVDPMSWTVQEVGALECCT